MDDVDCRTLFDVVDDDSVVNGVFTALNCWSLLLNMYRLFVAAIAIIFSFGCQLVCKIFFVKSKLSTQISSFLLVCRADWLRLAWLGVPEFWVRFEARTRLGLRSCLSLAFSLEHSYICSCLVWREIDLKKLWYEPLRMCLWAKRFFHLLFQADLWGRGRLKASAYSSFELQQHSNLSNIQSFSYKMHNLLRR